MINDSKENVFVAPSRHWRNPLWKIKLFADYLKGHYSWNKRTNKKLQYLILLWTHKKLQRVKHSESIRFGNIVKRLLSKHTIQVNSDEQLFVRIPNWIKVITYNRLFKPQHKRWIPNIFRFYSNVLGVLLKSLYIYKTIIHSCISKWYRSKMMHSTIYIKCFIAYMNIILQPCRFMSCRIKLCTKTINKMRNLRKIPRTNKIIMVNILGRIDNQWRFQLDLATIYSFENILFF